MFFHSFCSSRCGFGVCLLVCLCAVRAGRRRRHIGTLTAQNGQNALIRAAMGGHTDCVRLLLDAGADKNAKTKVRQVGLPRLPLAVYCGSFSGEFGFNLLLINKLFLSNLLSVF
jgi:ankyrin repeat protein